MERPPGVSMNKPSIDKTLFDKMFSAALNSQKNAYAPYSKFKVGASIKLINDETIYTGCNVENRSNGATICAERTALTDIIKRTGECKIETLLVMSTTDNQTIAPCGICRQMLSEFGPLDAKVFICDSHRGLIAETTLKDLIPFPF